MSHRREIAVIGLGCVGLPVAGASARAGANAADARHEYGVAITELGALQPADAVILAVAHASYLDGGWSLVQKLLIGGTGLVLDVKMKLDRGSQPAGIELWRL
jgi:UDP-N-acetyl-D-galactosamine dehydrogenase